MRDNRIPATQLNQTRAVTSERAMCSVMARWSRQQLLRGSVYMGFDWIRPTAVA